MKINSKSNNIVCGDNLEWLNWIEDGSIDLCYIDPPFFSNRNYEVVWGNGAELRSFGDRFSGGITHYTEWMRERISLIHKKLKPTGSIFLHCDYHASHRLRCVLDEVFGEKNFRNEIVWHYGQRMMSGVKQLNKKHDNIIWYSKSKDFFYKEITESYTLEEVRSWRGTKWDDVGEYYLENGGKGKPRYKRYIKDILDQGKVIDDVWDIRILGSTDKERIGYPTQKPEKLISRIIEMASKKNDVVLDCFGGGGTTAKCCVDLGRKFIVGDVSPVACRIMADRISQAAPLLKFDIKNLPSTESEFRSIDGHEFANLFCDIVGWKVKDRKTGDGGIDGFDSNGIPVQIKNTKNKASRPELQKFVGALLNTKFKEGKFVSWEFSREAIEYIAEIRKTQKINIEPIKCADRLGALIIEPEKQLILQDLYEQKRNGFGKVIDLPVKKKKSKVA